MKQEKLFGGIDTVIIRVSNIVDARDWYTQTLGLNLIWDDPGAKLVVFDTGGPTSLTLWQTEKKIETDHHRQLIQFSAPMTHPKQDSCW